MLNCVESNLYYYLLRETLCGVKNSREADTTEIAQLEDAKYLEIVEAKTVDVKVKVPCWWL